MRARVVVPLLALALAGLGWWWYGARRSGEATGAGADRSPVELAGLTRPRREGGILERLTAKADARGDDWETEQLHDRASGQLGVIAHAIEVGTPSASELGAVVAEGFECVPLRPGGLATVFDDGVFVVRRAGGGAGQTLRGAEGLTSAVAELAGALGPDGRHVKFKPFTVEAEGTRFTTRNYYEASGHDDRSALQQSAVWTCSWIVPAGAEEPLLERIAITSYEEVTVQATGGALFADVTESALGANTSYAAQVLPGIDDWLTRQSRMVDMWIYGQHGIAVGDANGDGLEDLYVCDAGGLPNRLYVQNTDGTATERASELGVDWLEYGSSALWLDLDQDGDQDLVVATRPQLLLAENDGSGHFELRDAMAVVDDPLSLAAADFDLDGDVDVYVCVYNPSYEETAGTPMPIPYHDANNGGANVLLRNEGDFRFSDVTREVGLDANNKRFSFAAAWEDYDDDGDVDLYVANDFGRNNLFRNDGGRFTDVAASAGVEDIASGMSVAWGDYDRDGRRDVYVSNMFSSAGNRVTYQRRFEAGRDAQTVANVRRMARGNSLFANLGDGRSGTSARRPV